MKKILLSAAVFLITFTAFSQARTATAEINKVMQPAIETEIPFEEKTVLKSLNEKMEKRGYKGKDNKGYTIYKGVSMAELGSGSYDLYFKTDRKSRKEKDITILTMLISSGNEKFVGETDDATLYTNAKNFLDNHVESATAYDLELQIKEQQELSQKADKKYNNLVEDGQDLVKKKEKIEKEIVENTQKQVDQKAEGEKQRQILSTLMGKRKQ
jgi:hypothetical protein